jgi:hypothetical protein
MVVMDTKMNSMNVVIFINQKSKNQKIKKSKNQKIKNQKSKIKKNRAFGPKINLG